jgi:dephospho-CoA kinase
MEEGRMKRVLITGTAGTGKSTVIGALRDRGYKAVDTDYDGYAALVHVPFDQPTTLEPGIDWLWQEDRIAYLLATEDVDTLFVGGFASNMSAYFDRFDAIVLLTASPDLVIDRLTTRTNNPFGQKPEDVERALAMRREFGPLLRRHADLVIDTSIPVMQVVTRLLEHIGLE